MNSKKRYFFNRYYLVCTKVGLCTKVSLSSLIPTLKLYTYLRFVIPFCQNENKVQIILFTTSYKLPLVFFTLGFELNHINTSWWSSNLDDNIKYVSEWKWSLSISKKKSLRQNFLFNWSCMSHEFMMITFNLDNNIKYVYE